MPIGAYWCELCLVKVNGTTLAGCIKCKAAISYVQSFPGDVMCAVCFLQHTNEALAIPPLGIGRFSLPAGLRNVLDVGTGHPELEVPTVRFAVAMQRLRRQRHITAAFASGSAATSCATSSGGIEAPLDGGALKRKAAASVGDGGRSGGAQQRRWARGAHWARPRRRQRQPPPRKRRPRCFWHRR